ncbi:MAG: hypothetical protein ACEQSM_06220, partial [Aliarcobacter sp.]
MRDFHSPSKAFGNDSVNSFCNSPTPHFSSTDPQTIFNSVPPLTPNRLHPTPASPANFSTSPTAPSSTSTKILPAPSPNNAYSALSPCPHGIVTSPPADPSPITIS